mgnify:CR=1
MLNWFFRLTTDTGSMDRNDDLVGFQQSRKECNAHLSVVTDHMSA